MCGPLEGAKSEPIALTYASSEPPSIEREKSPEWTTARLVERWVWHNNIRSAVLVIGTVLGAFAVSLDGPRA